MRILVCALCGKPGGTFVNSPQGKIHQDGDCQRAEGIFRRTLRKMGVLQKVKRKSLMEVDVPKVSLDQIDIQKVLDPHMEKK